MKIGYFYTTFVLFIILTITTDVFACACCADEGYYKISVHKPKKFETNILKSLTFHDANLYTTNAFPEDIKGLNPIGDRYKVQGSIGGNKWSFTFTDENGKTGMVNLRTPKKIVNYAVDTRESKQKGMVVLYKEWRFKFKVATGSGIFKDGLKSKTEYFLVLQGRGNLCPETEQFTHWRLEITGKKANYAFYGKVNVKNDSVAENNFFSIPKIVKNSQLNSYSFLNRINQFVHLK